MPTLRRESVEGGMAGPLHLKVFLSSPSDVADERELARRLIKDELPYDPLLRGKAPTRSCS